MGLFVGFIFSLELNLNQIKETYFLPILLDYPTGPQQTILSENTKYWGQKSSEVRTRGNKVCFVLFEIFLFIVPKVTRSLQNCLASLEDENLIVVSLKIFTNIVY